jgi:hypothetical protein
VRKSAFQAVGGFPVGIRCGEDTAVWARLALAYDVVASGRPEAVYYQGSTAVNTQCRYFGRAAHFDHLSLLDGQAGYMHYDDLEKWVTAKSYQLAMTALVHGDDPETVRDILARVTNRHWRLRRQLIKALLLVPDSYRKLLFRLTRPSHTPQPEGAC